jgi:hypothetical protein
MENRSRIHSYFIVCAFLFSGIGICVISVSANPLTEVTITLFEEEVHVDVSPGSTGIVTIDGSVTCEKWGFDQVTVYLNATSTHGEASVVPPSMIFGGSGGSVDTLSFIAQTRVPQGTSSSELVTLTVDGVYTQGGLQYDMESKSSLIIVDQYFQIEANSTEGFSRREKAGENTDITLNIHNAGNGNDIFEIDFKNRESLEGYGFNLPSPMDLSMPEKSSENVSLAIGIPEDISGTYDMEISITSLGSKNSNKPFILIIPIEMKVLEKSIGDHIGSFILSPLMLVVIILVIIAVIVIRKKRSG